MTAWIVLAAMTAAVIAVLALPLLRRSTNVAPRSAHDLEVYRDQLAEIERDRTRGTLSETEAEAARAEIARRVLSAANKLPSEAGAAPTPPSSRLLPLAAAAAAPVVALLLYAGYGGSPGLPSQPFAAREDKPADFGGQITQMVAGLAARLKENPNDLEGWQMLARSYTTLERNADAVTAWRKVLDLSGNADVHAGSLGESIVRAADGIVTPEARALFERAKAADAHDARAGFYLGLAYSQEGDSRRAVQTWTDLIAMSPPDAPWLATVQDRIRRVAAAANIDPATITPSPEAIAAAQQRGPSAADVAAIQRMTPDERAALVRGMVGQLAARLESEPGDLEGWRRLGRAYQVLGDRDKASEALGKAAALAPDRAEVLAEYAATLLGDRAADEKLPPAFVTLMRRVLALDAENGEALWFVGLAELEDGRKDAAVALWDKLIGRLPPNSPAHAEVKQQLDKLRSAN
jgi:cytochrome c-type biogenesis protein CcmH